MRAAAALPIVLAGLSVPAALGAPPQPRPVKPVVLPAGTATAKADPATAGARPVTLTVTLRTELLCGRPRGGPVVVSLPAALRVPERIPRTSILVGGHPAAGLAQTGRVVSLTLRPTSGMTCMSIAPGNVTVVFTHAAGLGNPPDAGRYDVTIRVGAARGVAQLTVS